MDGQTARARLQHLPTHSDILIFSFSISFFAGQMGRTLTRIRYGMGCLEFVVLFWLTVSNSNQSIRLKNHIPHRRNRTRGQRLPNYTHTHLVTRR